ncbi:hypothetical protein K3495_g12743 [Podosphaera aphanis]|nr:hypothetical protein K3495_g12743 [Podosphaera aphanis]
MTEVLPSFDQAGRFSGDGSSGARWLSRLQYDFQKAGYSSPPPHLFFYAVDILFDGEAASWLDSTPMLRLMIDDREQSTKEQVAEFKEHLSARFPSQIIDYSEGNIQHDIKAFSQVKSEPLMAYYQRALHLLRRAHGRDNHKSLTGAKALAPVEQVVLDSIISAFVEGLQDEDLRNEVFSRSILSCGSLWRSVEIIKETQQSLNLAREAKNRSAEKQEIQQIRALCAAQFGKSVTSVLADLSSGNLALSRAPTGRDSDAETISQRQQAENPEIQSRVAPETFPERLHKFVSREIQLKANEQQLPPKGYQVRGS